MIEYIKGNFLDLTPATVVVETTAGVAYLVNITLPTYEALQGRAEGKLLVHESIREDAWTLFGFVDNRERTLFRELIGVSGVGVTAARIILSSIPAAELELVIANGEEKRLKSVKGIGTKTAQRIIVDLKGKIDLTADETLPSNIANNAEFENAMAALVALGFPRPASEKALKKIFEDDPAAKTETAIKKAFTML